MALAKALLNKPDVLLLDEPTASLDPDTADWVRTYLETYRSETNATILLASHNMLEVERLCGLVLMMRKGSIVDRGTPADLLERYGRDTMEDVFLDIARERRTGGVADAADSETEETGRWVRLYAASRRWCCATGICCAAHGRVFWNWRIGRPSR